jgi:hypothetical protein
MAKARGRDNDYPTYDRRTGAESDWHREAVTLLIRGLQGWFATRRQVVVPGQVPVSYDEACPRKHVLCDVFVVKGVAKAEVERLREELNVLRWQRGKES